MEGDIYRELGETGRGRGRNGERERWEAGWSERVREGERETTQASSVSFSLDLWLVAFRTSRRVCVPHIHV